MAFSVAFHAHWARLFPFLVLNILGCFLVPSWTFRYGCPLLVPPGSGDLRTSEVGHFPIGEEIPTDRLPYPRGPSAYKSAGKLLPVSRPAAARQLSQVMDGHRGPQLGIKIDFQPRDVGSRVPLERMDVVNLQEYGVGRQFNSGQCLQLFRSQLFFGDSLKFLQMLACDDIFFILSIPQMVIDGALPAARARQQARARRAFLFGSGVS